jgi:hypothetical protein
MYTTIKTLLIISVFGLGILFNKEVSGLLPDNSKVVYNLSDDKKLNGAFAISTKDDKLVIRGSYKDGKRAGNWYCFNPDGTVFMRYNYDINKLVALDSAIISRVKVEIVEGNEEAKKVASIPVPVCSMEQYISLLGAEFRRLILAENKTAQGTIAVELTASIDRNGKAGYMGIYTVDRTTVTKRLNPNNKMFNIEWIPASYKGEKLAANFKINMTCDLSSNDSSRQRFRWANF